MTYSSFNSVVQLSCVSVSLFKMFYAYICAVNERAIDGIFVEDVRLGDQ